jgi:hypothetical protein
MVRLSQEAAMPIHSRQDDAARLPAEPRAGLSLRAPDLGSTGACISLAVLVFLAGALFYGRDTLLTVAFGDTDDAMRMVMVRDLLNGQAWFNHGVARLQPPLGLEMHWSRLVDGALAGLFTLLTPLVGVARAETWVRTAWPLFWLLPASLAAWAIASRLGGRRAIGPCALLLLLSPTAFFQFVPGRIDHHDLQVVGVLAILAGAIWMDRAPRAGWLAGIATGLLVTVGLEALMFAALIGAAIALRLAADASIAPGARRYALGLGLSTAFGFLAQTDPARWTASACDALAVNLLAALLVAALSLGWSAYRVEHGGLAGRRRLLAIAVTGLAAAAAYIAIEPACLRGPFATVDPRLYPIWLDLVKEVWPLATWWTDAPPTALLMGATPVVALLLGLGLVAMTPARRDPAWLLVLAILALAVTLTFAQAIKGSSYAAWIAAPVTAAALTSIMRRWRNLLLPTLLATLALSPIAPLLIYTTAAGPQPAKPQSPSCNAPDDFTALAALPPGLVLADIDLGPMILAFTPHSALSAPYHRMPQGIIEAQALLNSPPAVAQNLVRQRGVAAVALCGSSVAPPFDTVPDNLYRQLKSGAPPAWLEPVPSSGALRVFRVLASTTG